MGRKGVSKRKPKTKSKPVSNAETNDSPRKGSSLVQSLVKNIRATLNRGGANPSAGSKKNRKGK